MTCYFLPDCILLHVICTYPAAQMQYRTALVLGGLAAVADFERQRSESMLHIDTTNWVPRHTRRAMLVISTV